MVTVRSWSRIQKAAKLMASNFGPSANVTNHESRIVIEAGRVAREQCNIKYLEVRQSATSYRRDSLFDSQYKTRLARAEWQPNGRPACLPACLPDAPSPTPTLLTGVSFFSDRQKVFTKSAITVATHFNKNQRRGGQRLMGASPLGNYGVMGITNCCSLRGPHV
jgi:hypothetical protein